ncbi:hypothetical protein AA313_de0200710 [Arthrobotrys entomopaga]|nr:hypothetical protein AA313_de0200710 [Arthrobotrys entomopaga]
MHFAFYKLSTSPNPRVQYCYTSYTVLLILIQVYVFIEFVYHIRLVTRMFDFDPLFIFHFVLSWVTSVSTLMRFIEHVKAKDFEEFIKLVVEGNTVGRFDGVLAAAWAVPYVMVLFAIFGDYNYSGVTYLIPVPFILGFTLSRWLYNRMIKEYQTGEYAKISTGEDLDEYREGLPVYEERERELV